jgi:hypothetical protein
MLTASRSPHMSAFAIQVVAIQPSIKVAFFFNLKNAKWLDPSASHPLTGRVTRPGASDKCQLDQDAIADLSWQPE